MRHVVTSRGILLPAENGNLIVDTSIEKHLKKHQYFPKCKFSFHWEAKQICSDIPIPLCFFYTIYQHQ